MYPSKSQQQAIEATLNFMLGADIYNRLFIGLECGRLEIDTVSIFVESEDSAVVIETQYSSHLVLIVESVLKKPIKYVKVFSKNSSVQYAKNCNAV